MAVTQSASSLRIRVDWEDAPGVASQELAATWCRFAMSVGDQSLTEVDADGVRAFLYLSAYPLAEWVAYMWWSLNWEIRVSDRPQRFWSWSHIEAQPWLRRHNLRGAGGGMPWPDVTLVPDGATTAVSWRGGSGLDGRLRFLNSGAVSTPSGQVTQTLAGFVERVLDRLTDLGVVNTPLQQEWDAIRTMSLDEIDFAKAAGRLGLDPFDVDADLVDAILRAGKELPDALLEEFLDSVDPEAIGAAHNWLSTARTRAGPPQPWQPPDLDLGDSAESGLLPSAGRPWEAGFRLAREVRSRLQVSRDQAFPIHDLVEDLTVDEPAGGLRGLVVARTTRPRIVMPRPYPSATVRFAQAQALGLLLLGAGRTEFVVSPAHTLLASAARSFAAELLVPADAIRDRIPRGPADERFFEVIGAEFGASPFVAQHQYDNQVVGARDVVGD